MKHSKFTTLFALVATSFVTAAHADEPVRKPKVTNFESLKQEAKALAEELENASDCEFKVNETRQGLTLSVRDSKNASVYVDVATEAQITIGVETLDRDDSFARRFKIAGEGELRLLHADDAFDRAELTDRTGRELSCELDM